MIERLGPLPRRLDRHPQALHRRALADILFEALRAELPLHLGLVGQRHPAHHARLVGHGRTPPR